MEFLKLVLAHLFLCTSSCYAYFKLAGPYEITIGEIRECEDVGTHQLQHGFQIKKLNATTRVVLINMTYHFDADDTVTLNVSGSKWSTGGWGKNAWVKDGLKFCRSWHDFIWEAFRDWSVSSDAPAECPIKAGSHIAKPPGVPGKYTNLRMFPQLPYGRYKVEVIYVKGGIRVGCIVIVNSIDEIASTLVIG